MASLCKCGAIREVKTASDASHFPGRKYYQCQSCSQFDWAGTPAKLCDTEVGPPCGCKKSSVQRAVVKNSPNKGRKFWCCTEGRGKGCNFFEWKEDHAASSAARKLDFSQSGAESKKRPALPGYASYLSDWKKVETVQKMMTVDPKFMNLTDERYDSIDVVGLWKISNRVREEKFEAAKERIKKDCPKRSDYGIPVIYSKPMNALSNNALDDAAGEVLLLHGTGPENLHGILFEGYDTALSNNGNFGR